MLRTLSGLTLVALLLLFAPAAPGAGDRFLPADHPFLKLLATSKVTRGREYRALLVVPIAADRSDPAGFERPLTSVEAAKAEALTIAEPEKKPGRGPVEVFNWGTKPVLLLGGEILEGGRRDRFLARDVLLKPGSKLTAPAYPADRVPRAEKEAGRQLDPLGAQVPDLLRLLGLMSGPASSVQSFLTDELALASLKTPRGSVVDLLAAPRLTERVAEYRSIFAAIPAESSGKTIGVAGLVGERLVGIDLFGTNAELRAHWPALLRAWAFQAALYELSYGLLDQPFPVARDPDRHQVPLREILRKPMAARTRQENALSLGEEVIFAREQVIGRALIHEERLVHATILVDLITNPPDANPPPEGGTEEVSPAELGRRADRGGYLTEYEKRLLERMRERRRNRPNPGGGSGTGPGGGVEFPGGDGD